MGKKNRADCYYDAQRKAYVISAKGGGNEVLVYDNGIIKLGVGKVDLTTIRVGSNALTCTISQILGWVGTCGALSSVPTAAIAIGTITGATAIEQCDIVCGMAKADRSAGHVGIAGFYIPTTNCLNVHLQNFHL